MIQIWQERCDPAKAERCCLEAMAGSTIKVQKYNYYYQYLLHDFDAETCAASKPPFRLTPATTWFCLVYARRWGQAPAPADQSP